MTRHDRRITPARPDLAAVHLKGHVQAERFAEGQPFRVAIDRTPMRAAPDADKPFDTVLLYGEEITLYEIKGPWAWGQSQLDGYVGYVPRRGLQPAAGITPTHRISTLFAQVYPAPKLKLPPFAMLPFGARVPIEEVKDGYGGLPGGRWIAAQHISPLSDPIGDWVDVAEMFMGVPYVWGGRSSAGLDCSALVQLSMQAAGLGCPRDSDMQEAALGETLEEDADLQRGDLIFWKGHVGIMASPEILLHANAHHRAVALEPLDDAVARIQKGGEAGHGAITRRARVVSKPT